MNIEMVLVTLLCWREPKWQQPIKLVFADTLNRIQNGLSNDLKIENNLSIL